jgi:hypothetical protein
MGTLMNAEADDHRATTLVWIDGRQAVIIRMQGGRAHINRVESEVPAHHRATGHVRHDPAVRHGGGGSSPQSAGEPHRIEHLNRFIEDVAHRLPPGDDVLVLGPGTVHERLMRHLSESDEHHGRHRDIFCQTSSPLTDRQLIALLRRFSGVEPRRFSVGAYRWSEPSAHRASGKAGLPPHRVVIKPPRERGQEAPGE